MHENPDVQPSSMTVRQNTLVALLLGLFLGMVSHLRHIAPNPDQSPFADIVSENRVPFTAVALFLFAQFIWGIWIGITYKIHVPLDSTRFGRFVQWSSTTVLSIIAVHVGVCVVNISFVPLSQVFISVMLLLFAGFLGNFFWISGPTRDRSNGRFKLVFGISIAAEALFILFALGFDTY